MLITVENLEKSNYEIGTAQPALTTTKTLRFLIGFIYLNKLIERIVADDYDSNFL